MSLRKERIIFFLIVGSAVIVVGLGVALRQRIEHILWPPDSTASVDSASRIPMAGTGLTEGAICGRVIASDTGTSIPAANVSTDPPTGSVTTDAQGNFSILNVPPGDYTVTSNKPSYRSASVRVSVLAGQMTIADLHLGADGPDMLADPTLETAHTNDLVVYFPFDGNADDASETGNRVTEHGEIEYAAGLVRQAARFDGIDDWIEVTGGLNFDRSFTVSFFASTNSSNAFLIQKGETCPNGNPSYKGTAYYIYIGGRYTGGYQSEGEGYLTSTVVENRGNYFDDRITASSQRPISMDGYHHIAVVFNNNRFLFYVDGQEIDNITFYERGPSSSTTNISPDSFSGIHQTEASLKIGGDESYCSGIHHYRNFFEGWIDELRMYNRALTKEEIQALGEY